VTRPIRDGSHGGARRGAGRPRKWQFDHVLTVGHACEVRWLEACALAKEASLASLPYATDIRAIQSSAQLIPVWQRAAWVASDAYDDHSDDIAAWLHERAGTPIVNDAFEGDAPRVVTVSTKPPRGTRQAIIREVAATQGLAETAVDNLWQEYRRFQREYQEGSTPAST